MSDFVLSIPSWMLVVLGPAIFFVGLVITSAIEEIQIRTEDDHE